MPSPVDYLPVGVEFGVATRPIPETEPSFYERNRDLLGSFIAEFGIDPRVADDLDELVAATQPWVSGDHARPDNRVEVGPQQSDRLHAMYDQFGLKKAQHLPDGQYDYILALGSIHLGNNRRLGFINEELNRSAVTTERLILLGGVRAVYPEVEDKLIAENIQQLDGKAQSDPFVRSLIEGTSIVQNETDMLRLAAAVKLGNLVVRQESTNRIDFDWAGLPVLLTHTMAVHRPNGFPRHTTEACLADFIKIIRPRNYARVGFIATNPHIERVTRSATRVLAAYGRSDIKLVAAGPHALDGYTHELFRGEVARNLYEDRLQQAQ